MFSGCALEEVRSKNKFGSEWRHSGSRSTAEERYSVEPGFEFKWDKGISTGVSYRRRDIDNGSGDSDNGLFVDFSFPLWKRPKGEAKTTERIEKLERRLAELEAARAERLSVGAGGTHEEILGGSEQHVAQVMGGTIPNAHDGTSGE
jgi:hypothetical protein